jgi:hypothetical protein
VASHIIDICKPDVKVFHGKIACAALENMQPERRCGKEAKLIGIVIVVALMFASQGGSGSECNAKVLLTTTKNISKVPVPPRTEMALKFF